MENPAQLAGSLQRGDARQVSELTKSMIEGGLSPKQILDEGLIAGMTVVGARFKNHEIFLPDVLLAARAMVAGLELLKPLLIKEGVETIGKVVIGTVRGDLHDIGKNLVGIMLKGAGFDVIDLGNDVPPEKFVDAARRENAGIVGMSALLTTTMPVMKDVVDLIRKADLPSGVKIIVGGAPLSWEYARQIGADAYCCDGVSAVECVKGYYGRG